MNKEIYIEGIGKLTLIRSSKATQLSIRMRPFEAVKVTIPQNIDEKSAIEFVARKAEWIKKAKLKMRVIEKKKSIYTQSTQNIIPGYDLIFRENKGLKTYITTAEKKILVSFPPGTNLEHENIQAGIENAILHILRYEAKRQLPFRTHELAKAYGFKYRTVTIRNAKTRWGSCSHNNNINLSLHLMRLPKHLADYIILHELCHTIHKNHGKDFWLLLDKVSEGKSNFFKQQLKEYSLRYL